jgi:hypothetical protein
MAAVYYFNCSGIMQACILLTELISTADIALIPEWNHATGSRHEPKASSGKLLVTICIVFGLVKRGTEDIKFLLAFRAVNLVCVQKHLVLPCTSPPICLRLRVGCVSVRS